MNSDKLLLNKLNKIVQPSLHCPTLLWSQMFRVSWIQLQLNWSLHRLCSVKLTLYSAHRIGGTLKLPIRGGGECTSENIRFAVRLKANPVPNAGTVKTCIVCLCNITLCTTRLDCFLPGDNEHNREYIVHGSKNQNDSNFKLTLERVCRNECDVSICFYLIKICRSRSKRC